MQNSDEASPNISPVGRGHDQLVKMLILLNFGSLLWFTNSVTSIYNYVNNNVTYGKILTFNGHQRETTGTCRDYL